MMARAAAAKAASRSDPVPRPVSLPAAGTALLLIDVIDDLAFAGSAALINQAEPMRAASHLQAARRRRTDVGHRPHRLSPLHDGLRQARA